MRRLPRSGVDGIDEERLAWVMDLKNVRRDRMSEYATEFGCEHHLGRPSNIEADLAFPCATENEISTEEARVLIKNDARFSLPICPQSLPRRPSSSRVP